MCHILVQTGPFSAQLYNNCDSNINAGDLFEVDTLPTGVGTGEYLHLAMLHVYACVIGDKGTDTELL